MLVWCCVQAPPMVGHDDWELRHAPARCAAEQCCTEKLPPAAVLQSTLAKSGHQGAAMHHVG